MLPALRAALPWVVVASITAVLNPPVVAQVGMSPWMSSPPGTTVYVDPIGGNDTPTDPAGPYRTINAAIDAAFAQLPADLTKQALVQCMPGRYSPSTNGEAFPIRMRRRVHVQGTGAKECVIRGEGTSSRGAWVPRVGGPVFDTTREVLVDFTDAYSTIQADMNRESMIDGFTFQGGYVQVYFPVNATKVRGRVSNCLFDLRGGGMDLLVTPSFGVIMVSLYVDSPPTYYPGTLLLLNNTFIHGWNSTSPGPEFSTRTAVAICDMTDGQDQNPSVGLNTPCIQNNLIRQRPDRPRLAFMGVNAAATSTQSGVNTNAFDASQVGQANAGFASAIVNGIGNAPVPAIDTAIPANRTGFVGEMLERSAGLINPYVRDFRVLWDSAVIDQGQGPVNQLLIAANGATYEDHGDFTSSFDWDGEGHGNPRIEGSAPDIGFDEVSTMIIAGSYGNDSRSHGAPYHPSIQAGHPQRFHLFPDPGTVSIRATLRPITAASAYLIPPGSLPGLSTPLGNDYLDPVFTFTPGPATMNNSTTWPNPIGRSHGFVVLSPPATEPPLPQHVNNQWVYQAVGASPVLTNLQREIF